MQRRQPPRTMPPHGAHHRRTLQPETPQHPTTNRTQSHKRTPRQQDGGRRTAHDERIGCPPAMTMNEPCEDSSRVPLKVKVPKKRSWLVRFFLHPVGKTFLAVFLIVLTVGVALFTYYYDKYAKIIDAKLSTGPFVSTSMLFAAPRTVMLGDEATPEEIATDLRRAGYSESHENRMGHFAITREGIEIYPGPDSFFKRDDGIIKFAGGKVAKIVSLGDNTECTQYALEPELMSNLF